MLTRSVPPLVRRHLWCASKAISNGLWGDLYPIATGSHGSIDRGADYGIALSAVLYRDEWLSVYEAF